MSRLMGYSTRFLFSLMLVLALFVPVMADDHDGEEETPEVDLVVVIGEAVYDDDALIVNGYVVELDDDTLVGEFEEGDIVIVVGILSEDATSVLAVSVELFTGEDPCEFDADEECEEIVEECDEVDAEECDDEEIIDEEDEEEEIVDDGFRGYACSRDDHPAGLKIAAQYDVSYEDVMDMFCAGYGFGEIMLAYRFAQGDADRLTEIRGQRENGMGWGNIRKNLRNAGDAEEGDSTDAALLSTGPRGKPDRVGNNGNDRGNSGNVGNANNNAGGNGRGNQGNNAGGNGRGNQGNQGGGGRGGGRP